MQRKMFKQIKNSEASYACESKIMLNYDDFWPQRFDEVVQLRSHLWLLEGDDSGYLLKSSLLYQRFWDFLIHSWNHSNKTKLAFFARNQSLSMRTCYNPLQPLNFFLSALINWNVNNKNKVMEKPSDESHADWW